MSRQKDNNLFSRNSRRWWFILSMAAMSVIGSMPLAYGVAAAMNIVQEGKSAFVIVVPKVAAQSVNDAAAELQGNIAESTGAKLPIVKDDDPINGPFISLGSTKQAQAAGVSAQGIAAEGFRIVTKGENLFIIGLDTTAVDLDRKKGRVSTHNTIDFELHPEIPGPAFTENGGASQGTANGVYTFLEDYLDVRWLMLGDIGRDIPQKSTFAIDNIDRTVEPMFIYRIIPFLGRNEYAFAWRNRMKLGASFRLNHAHAWQEIVPAKLYKQHPDWFAMDGDGQRYDPEGNRGYKLETTNPELIKFVADKAIEALKAQPELNTFSLSPTDGLGYSQSPESKALFDQGQITQYSGAPSVTPLILKFYSDVSAIVAKEYPQGKLAGYFYQQYRFPPSDGNAKIPDNFVPVLVAAASSYRGYRPEMREEQSSIINGWGKILPSTWFMYGHPTWLRDSTAMVAPAMPEYTNILFEDLVKNHCKGMTSYGMYSWSQGALSNYIRAKKLWDPQADAVAIQHEWLMRAYGSKAGAVMEEFYQKMDESWFSDYFRQPGTAGGQISEAFFRDIYGAHYPQMEEMILKAEAQPMTEIQKQRLKLISDNMRVMQWRMRNAGYLPADYSSAYTIDTDQVYKMMSDSDSSKGFRTFRLGVKKEGSEVTPVRVRIGQSNQADTADIPNSNFILLYPTKDGAVHLKPANVRPGSSFLYYFVHDGSGKVLKRGLLDNNTDVTFTAEANTPYYFETLHVGVTTNPQIKWKISIPGAIFAQASFTDGVLSLDGPSGSKPESLYVYVPESLELTTQDSEAGVVIQTLTTDEQKSRDRRAGSKAAETALTTGLKQYRGTLLQNLDSGWKFSPDPEKTGVQQGFAKSDFTDKPWKRVSTIGPWQSQGFEGYHGTGWYRKTFTVSSSDSDAAQLEDKKLLLFVGAVDGDAVFYLNGKKIADRKQYSNSWKDSFALDVSTSMVIGENTLAVQVTKEKFAAGLYRGVSLIAGVPKD